jgi:hypothetical protein
VEKSVVNHPTSVIRVHLIGVTGWRIQKKKEPVLLEWGYVPGVRSVVLWVTREFSVLSHHCSSFCLERSGMRMGGWVELIVYSLGYGVWVYCNFWNGSINGQKDLSKWVNSERFLL